MSVFLGVFSVSLSGGDYFLVGFMICFDGF